MKTTSFWIRIKRTFLMFRWLLSLFSRFRHLEQVDLATRKNIIRQAALDALTILNVHLDTDKLPENIHETGRLVVANHISWLDIFVISTLLPSGFIAMKEMRSWPMIGKIAENVGTVFIDRSNRKDIEPINAAIVQQLNTGANVCFF
ncbi:MAG: 1-acyl-sn-glycerol-3-phosphate acyltransferase, partial [Neisseriaceae bacterium]|nr:1-acyl-sn-glycerol-3-phosphate acyltransferase [Neisseriaceae bacterium]